MLLNSDLKSYLENTGVWYNSVESDTESWYFFVDFLKQNESVIKSFQKLIKNKFALSSGYFPFALDF